MKLLIGIILSVLSVSFLIVGLCCGQNTARENWAKGVEYAVQGNFSEAKKEFENALKVDPYNRSARATLKVVEDVIGQKTKSKTAVHFFKGVSHSKKRDWAEANAEYSKVIEINAKYVDAYNERAAAYYFKGQHDRAIADFTRAIEIEPSNAWAYFARGSVYHDKGQFGWAIADFTKAIEIDPELAMAYNNRGIAYFYIKEYEKAWDDVHKAQSLGHQVHPGFLNELREASGRER